MDLDASRQSRRAYPWQAGDKPLLRPIARKPRLPRLAVLGAYGAGSALAGAIAFAVYANAVSNPPVAETPAVAGTLDNAEDGNRPPPDSVPAAAKAGPAPDAPQALAMTASAIPDPAAGEEATVKAARVEAAAEAADPVVAEPLAPKSVKTIIIRSTADVPAADDPRWAVTQNPERNRALEALRARLAGGDEASGGKPDSTTTSALALADPGDDRAPALAARPAEPAAKGKSRKATITTSVNMRAKADSKSAVVAVIPEKAEVDLSGCKGWCRVTWKGKTGYVWKEFIRPGSAAKPLNALAGG